MNSPWCCLLIPLEILTAFTALSLQHRWQEGHPACKQIKRWSSGDGDWTAQWEVLSFAQTSHCQLHHLHRLLQQQNPERYHIVVPAFQVVLTLWLLNDGVCYAVVTQTTRLQFYLLYDHSTTFVTTWALQSQQVSVTAAVWLACQRALTCYVIVTLMTSVESMSNRSCNQALNWHRSHHPGRGNYALYHCHWRTSSYCRKHALHIASFKFGNVGVNLVRNHEAKWNV